MGLLNQLTNVGSAYTLHDGNTPPTNPLATQQSMLHAAGNLPGYSLNGSQSPIVSSQYNAYEDGMPNPLPPPSLLDLNGAIPPITPGGQLLPYLNNLPQ